MFVGQGGYRRYLRTQRRVTSPENSRHVRGLVGVIGMKQYPTRQGLSNFATERYDWIARQLLHTVIIKT